LDRLFLRKNGGINLSKADEVIETIDAGDYTKVDSLIKESLLQDDDQTQFSLAETLMSRGIRMAQECRAVAGCSRFLRACCIMFAHFADFTGLYPAEGHSSPSVV